MKEGEISESDRKRENSLKQDQRAETTLSYNIRTSKSHSVNYGYSLV